MNKIQWLIECDGLIFSFIAMVVLRANGYHKSESGKNIFVVLFLNMMIPLFDIMAYSLQAQLDQISVFFEASSNFILYFCEFLLIVFMGRYIMSRLKQFQLEVSNRWLIAIYIIFIIYFIGLIVNQFTGIYYYFDSANIYHRGDYFIIPMGLGLIGVLVEFYQVIKHRKEMERDECYVLMSYFMGPTIGLILQFFFYDISFMNIGFTLSVFVVLFNYVYQQQKIQKEQDQRLILARAHLLNSQIKPHFFFNALSVIQSLIEIDPDTAQEALGHFSRYMRKNLNMNNLDKPVDIDEELDLIHNYLYIQKLRFGDRVKVHYEIEDGLHFSIPFLTIQPLVENAIHHGIRRKVEDGNVTIRIYEEEQYIIQIIDDGVGFDYNKLDQMPKDVNSNGVGMKNVEQRLQIMCNGSMHVESNPGSGTTITLRIPKKKKDYKNN